MGNEHITYVFNSEDVKGADRLMLLAIADYCDEHGGCYPSYGKLAQKCNVTRRSAISTCQRLEADGHIHIATQKGYETSKGKTNRFYMLKWRESKGIDNNEILRGDVDDTPRGDVDDTPRGDVDITQSLVVSQEKPKSLSSDDDAPNPSDKPKPQKRDALKDWTAKHIFKVDPFNVPDSLGFLVGNWVNGIREVHKLYGTTPTIAHLERFIQWYEDDQGNIEYPRDRKKLVGHYTRFYQSQKQAQENGKSSGDISIYRKQPKAWETT